MRRTHDGGYTLTELLVVMGLLGMIMGIGYAGLHITTTGSNLSDEQSKVSREIGAPLDLLDQVLTQARGFDVSYPGIKPNRCAVFTDQDADGSEERWLFEVVGTELRVTNEEYGGRASQTTVWSESNGNIAAGVPLFRYYGADGEITTMGEVADKATHFVVTVVVTTEDSTLTDSRTVFKRN